MRAPLPPLDTPRLSTSEKRVITLATTMKDHQIATQLGITKNTVRMTLQHARQKQKDVADMRRLSGELKGAPDIKQWRPL